MADHQGQVTCPRCGTAAGVRSLAELISDAQRGRSAARPQADWRPTDWSGQDTANGEPGDGPDLGETIFDFAMAVTAHVLRVTVGRRMKQAYQQRIAPEIARGRQASLSQQLQLAERHPELRICTVDQMVFLPGGNRAVPASQIFRPHVSPDAALDALVAELRAQ
jgi:hypothetical protein